MAGIINTAAVFNNGWNSGANEQTFTGTISVHPDMEKTYDYVLTSDPVLLQERKQIQEDLYEIFKDSPFFEKYSGVRENPTNPEEKIYYAKKIERSDVANLFFYMKEQLEQNQQLNITELIMHICEFFELNYDYIINTVLTTPLKAKLYKEVYHSGHKKIIDESETLF